MEYCEECGDATLYRFGHHVTCSRCLDDYLAAMKPGTRVVLERLRDAGEPLTRDALIDAASREER